MKTTRIKLTTMYFNHSIVLRLPAEMAQKIMAQEDPMECIYVDCDRLACGYKPLYLSDGQVRKIRNYNKESGDYFNKVEYYEKD